MAVASADAKSFVPVQIQQCQLLNWRNYVSPYPLGGVHISFINRAAASADEIRFLVRVGRRSEQVTDHGVFSQNVLIDHGYRAFGSMKYESSIPDSCSVEFVHYTTGASWHR